MTEPTGSAPEHSAGIDRGTQLGAGTGLLVRILTRCVTGTRRVRCAIAATLHALVTAFRLVFPIIRLALIALFVVAFAPVLIPIWLVVMLARLLRRPLAAVRDPVLAAFAAASRTVAQGLRALGRHAQSLARRVAHTIGTAASWIRRLLGAILARLGLSVRRVAAAFVRAVAAVLRAVTGRLAAVLVPVGRMLAAVARRTRDVIARVFGATVMLVRRALHGLLGYRQRLSHSIGTAIAQARQQTARPEQIDHWVDDVPPGTMPAVVTPFSVRVYQNEYLPAGGTRVDAIVTVEADDLEETSTANRPEVAQVILVDCSGSMGRPWSRMRGARRATLAAIEAMRPGTWFAVVRANHDAEPIFPPGGGLAPKTAETERAARRALGRLWPEGGTAMGRWLLQARTLLATRPHAIRHAILLTDGRNESESEDELREALNACAGEFGCDCRGVGTDWEVAQLRMIATAMHGTVDIIPDARNVAADFIAMADATSHKHTDGVSIHIWTPLGATVRTFQQVAPYITDLNGQREVGDVVEYATGSWSTEAREYHLGIDVPAKAVGTEMLAARFTVTVGDRVVGTTLVRAAWTDDVALSTRVAPRVEHFTGQTEVLEHVRRGLEARRIGDDAAAVHHLAQATRLAAETGHESALALLASVVDIEDAPTGRITAKAAVDDADWMALDTRSTRTSRPAPELYPADDPTVVTAGRR